MKTVKQTMCYCTKLCNNKPWTALCYSAVFVLFMMANMSLSYAIANQSVSAASVKNSTINYLWLTKEQKTNLMDWLDMEHLPIRFKYQQTANGRAWLLSEYGKEELIDFSVLVNERKVRSFDIVTYREPVGGEIAFASFRQQFTDIFLVTEKQQQSLSNRIDGITGATISVKASERVAKLALWLDAVLDVDT